MSSPREPSVVVSGLGFSWPDGTVVLRDIDAAFGAGRTGLIGANGTGKSTLLKLVAGRLTPTSGTVRASGTVGFLPQQLTLRTDAVVAELLGIAPRLAALRAIESGDADPRHFDALADDWEVEARARAALDALGLTDVALDRAVGALSGGEAMQVALAGLRLSGADIVLLDEPTNDLDRAARHRLYDAVAAWRGTLVVVSHDVTLLDLMEETAELRGGAASVFGGPYTAYREHLAGEQAAAEQAVRTAKQALRTERRQRIEAETKLAHRARYAQKDFQNKRRPKVIMNQRRREAEVSAGKLRGDLTSRVRAAQDALDAQEARLRDDAAIRVDLPDPEVPASRRLAEFRDPGGRGYVLQGPERVALVGRNGIGKTRLLEGLRAPGGPPRHSVRAIAHTDRIGFVPQRLDHLDDADTVLDAVRRASPHRTPGEVRAALARFLFRGAAAGRRIGELSGGERFRVALARVLLADPPAHLLVLDEESTRMWDTNGSSSAYCHVAGLRGISRRCQTFGDGRSVRRARA